MQNDNAGATELYSYNRRTTYNIYIFCQGIHLKLSSHFRFQALYRAKFENPKFSTHLPDYLSSQPKTPK